MELGFYRERSLNCLAYLIGLYCCRVQSYDLQNLIQFSLLSDAQLDKIVTGYLSHGLTSGHTYLVGYLRSLGSQVDVKEIE